MTVTRREPGEYSAGETSSPVYESARSSTKRGTAIGMFHVESVPVLGIDGGINGNWIGQVVDTALPTPVGDHGTYYPLVRTIVGEPHKALACGTGLLIANHLGVRDAAIEWPQKIDHPGTKTITAGLMNTAVALKQRCERYGMRVHTPSVTQCRGALAGIAPERFDDALVIYLASLGYTGFEPGGDLGTRDKRDALLVALWLANKLAKESREHGS